MKTKYSYVGVAFIILVFGIIFVPRIIDRISGNEVVRNTGRTTNIGTIPEKNSELAFIEINGTPKKVPEFSFTNQNGETISNKDYLGKVYVVEFFFTTCTTICPKMNSNLVTIQNAFLGIENFGIASFSINPDYDTQSVLKAYEKSYGITNPNWNLLTGSKDNIYDLANSGFNIFAEENPDVPDGFEHSGNFALIDKQGYIRSRYDSFGNPKIYYNGIISEEELSDEHGTPEEISLLKEDIKILLNE